MLKKVSRQSFALACSMEHPHGSRPVEGKTPAEVNVEVFLGLEKAYAEGKLRHQVRRNQFTDLAKYSTLTWLAYRNLLFVVTKKIVASQSATIKFPSRSMGR